MTSRDGNFWTSGALPLIPADAFGAMIAAASDVSIVISDVGRILGVTTGATMKDAGDLSRWEGRDIRDVLTVESVPKLEAELERVTGGEGSGTRLVELNHEDEGPWDFPVRYSFHPIGSDGAILMFGRDLRPVADMQQQLVRAQMALEREYEAQREYDTRMRVLMEATAEAVVFVSLGSGRVLECNSAAAALLGAEPGELVGKPLADLFEDGAEVMRGLGRAGETDAGPASVLTRGPRGRRIGLAPTLFRAAGERMALCRLTGTDRASAPSDSLSDTLTAFFRAGSDAIVVTDARGAVESANEAFLNLVDAAQASRVEGRPLAEFLARGSVDARVLTENAAQSGHMKFYATRVVSEFGSQVPVEISATYLGDRAEPLLVFVIRDASRIEALRAGVGPGGEDSVRSVMELVGSATLKDIVSETTEVVEKMCIETAVDLTRNNRVAAAEMLGLSRQSLYVKLRKYGLIKRSND